MPLFPILVPRPRAGAYAAAREAGYTIVQRQIEADTAAEADACNALLAAFDDVAAMRREMKRLVAVELERRLTLALSLARLVVIGGAAIRLLARNSGSPVANWPAADRNRLQAIMGRFERANDLLNAAEAIEALLDAAATVPQLRDIDVRNSKLWPR